jgi:histidinol-phosphatase (PHP family)
MQNRGLWDEEANWYQNEVLQTLEEIRHQRAIIEVNTRGIYKKLSNEPYPSIWILEHIREMQIPIQLNSDAHVPSEITRNFSEVAALLKNIGFRHLKVLVDGNWYLADFDINGLKL